MVTDDRQGLERSLGLGLMLSYGVGTILGLGIYVLLGKVAGEVNHVDEAFGRRALSVAVGWMIVLSAIVSTATVVNGYVGYVHVFVELVGIGQVIAVAGHHLGGLGERWAEFVPSASVADLRLVALG